MNFDNLFYLMHKDDITAGLEIDEASGHIIRVTYGQFDKTLLPPGGQLSPEALKIWWRNRAVPVGQGSMRRVLAENHIASPQAWLVKNCGVSLTDHYWIKPVESDYTWERINLFTNSFRDDMAELELMEAEDGERMPVETTFYPGASAQGELQKKWVIIEGKRYLVKGNYEETCQQCLNELFATMVHERQKRVPYVVYNLCEIRTEKGRGLGCICENFASEETEFIPAYDVVNSEKKRNDLSEYEHFIQICGKHGLDEDMVREFLEYQIMTDFLITNTDCHFNNFGVLRNSETLEYTGMAPVFDSGNSMFWNFRSVPDDDNIRDISVNSFRKREIDLLQYITNRRLVDLSRLPEEEKLLKIYQQSPAMEGYIANIINGYKKKICLFDRFQNGENIWKYGITNHSRNAHKLRV